MSFCQNCGTAASATAVFCGACGKAMEIEAGNTPAKSFTSENSSTEDLSEGWKKKFASIEKAGGPKLPRYKDLASNERSVIYNVWGFLFGPIYYLIKGMWKKAIVLFLIAIVGIVLFETILGAVGMENPGKISWIVSATIFATRANIDYYKKMVMGDNGWW